MGRQHTGAIYQEIPILEAARRCGLVLNSRTLEWDEVEASCPFCGDHGAGKYHLSLNTRKNVYRCNLCNARGNSVSLFARIEGISNRQAFHALSEEGRLFRFPEQPLSKKPPEREQVRAVLDPLLEALEAHYGVKPILYVTYRSYYRYVAGGDYAGYAIWCSSPIVFPLVPGWRFWQYSHSARLEGYLGREERIDLNIFRGSRSEFDAFGLPAPAGG